MLYIHIIYLSILILFININIDNIYQYIYQNNKKEIFILNLFMLLNMNNIWKNEFISNAKYYLHSARKKFNLYFIFDIIIYPYSIL